MCNYQIKKFHTIIINSITLSRVVVVIPIYFFTNLNYLIIVTVFAGLSDFADGFLARKWQVTTVLGAKLDQYADKIASLLLLFFFFKTHQLSILFSSLILVREIFQHIFRRLNWSNKQSNFIGKAKTFFLYVLFIFLNFMHLTSFFFIDIKMTLMLLAVGCSWVSFILSISKLTPRLIYGFGTTGLSATIVKRAPGTITSLLVFFLLFIGLNWLGLEYKIALFVILLFIHFVYYNSFLKQMNSLNDDPNIYTLDETLAIAMAWMYLGDLTIIQLIILFILFRFFDILKPLGIHKIEKQSKWSAATKNMADDILAMVYSLIIFQMIKIYVG